MMPLPGLGEYTLEVSKDGYMFTSVDFVQVGGNDLNRTPFQSIPIEPIKKGNELDLKSIYFEYNSAKLKETYQADLERLHHWLEDNPSLEVLIVGHTDSIGSIPYNMQLSLDRANSVREFLVNRGIELSRLQTDGKGPLVPIDTNRTEEGRARNRRVQVVVIR